MLGELNPDLAALYHKAALKNECCTVDISVK